jgi:hypothetical protein
MSGYICEECGWHGEKPCVTWIDMGGRPKCAFSCCPNCHGIKSTINKCCDEPGCKEGASCGTPYPGGYKQHCHRHTPNPPDQRAADKETP